METATEIATVEHVHFNLDPASEEGAAIMFLSGRIDELIESHNRILALLDQIESQIGPVIQGMSNGPIGKLMGL